MSKEQQRPQFALLPAIVTVIATCAVGAYSGWLVGASNSPVVSGFLPLLFGFAGALSLAYIELRKKPTPNAKSDSIGAEESPSLHGHTIVAGVCATIFCTASYFGVLEGVKSKVLSYAQLDSYSALHEAKTASDKAQVIRLYLWLKQNEVDASTANTIMVTAFDKAESSEGLITDGMATSSYKQIVDSVVSEIKPFRGKHIANVDFEPDKDTSRG